MSDCLCVCLIDWFYLTGCLAICLTGCCCLTFCVKLSDLWLSLIFWFCLTVCLAVYLFDCLPTCLANYLTVSRSVWLTAWLSDCKLFSIAFLLIYKNLRLLFALIFESLFIKDGTSHKLSHNLFLNYNFNTPHISTIIAIMLIWRLCTLIKILLTIRVYYRQVSILIIICLALLFCSKLYSL